MRGRASLSTDLKCSRGSRVDAVALRCQQSHGSPDGTLLRLGLDSAMLLTGQLFYESVRVRELCRDSQTLVTWNYVAAREL